MSESKAFTFGRNWLAFSKRLDAERLADARASLQDLLGRTSLEGTRMLDVGAGSGLFSIAAVQLGATHVTALDRDVDCLAAISSNARRLLTDSQLSRLDVLHGDVLTANGIPSGPFDIVYAWGSLHHTGAMWEAIEHAGKPLAPGGSLALAIYNETWTSPAWHAVKRAYHASPAWLRWLMVAALWTPRTLVRAVTGRRAARSERGMDVWHDAIDWLGGLPYEYATIGALEQFLSERGFDIVTRRLTRRAGCNELVAVRRGPALDGGEPTVGTRTSARRS